MEEYDVTTYPEGYEKVMREDLDFISEEERESFMEDILLFMISA